MDLLPGGMPGPPESKWCQNRLRPYLCLGPEPDAAPGDQEAEEYIEVGQLMLSAEWCRQQHSCLVWPAYRTSVGVGLINLQGCHACGVNLHIALTSLSSSLLCGCIAGAPGDDPTAAAHPAQPPDDAALGVHLLLRTR